MGLIQLVSVSVVMLLPLVAIVLMMILIALTAQCNKPMTQHGHAKAAMTQTVLTVLCISSTVQNVCHFLGLIIMYAHHVKPHASIVTLLPPILTAHHVYFNFI